jgi:hypothetical protein
VRSSNGLMARGNTKKGPSINQYEEVQEHAHRKGGSGSRGDFGP